MKTLLIFLFGLLALALSACLSAGSALRQLPGASSPNRLPALQAVVNPGPLARTNERP